MRINEYLLKEELTHCIGKSTVKVTRYNEYDFVWHFGSLILVYDSIKNIVVLNYCKYDYSQSTGRVRNTVLRYLGFNIYSKSKLNRYENKNIFTQLDELNNICIIKLYDSSTEDVIVNIIKNSLNKNIL